LNEKQGIYFYRFFMAQSIAVRHCATKSELYQMLQILNAIHKRDASHTIGPIYAEKPYYPEVDHLTENERYDRLVGPIHLIGPALYHV
jgi:hypothetical protein